MKFILIKMQASSGGCPRILNYNLRNRISVLSKSRNILLRSSKY